MSQKIKSDRAGKAATVVLTVLVGDLTSVSARPEPLIFECRLDHSSIEHTVDYRKNKLYRITVGDNDVLLEESKLHLHKTFSNRQNHSVSQLFRRTGQGIEFGETTFDSVFGHKLLTDVWTIDTKTFAVQFRNEWGGEGDILETYSGQCRRAAAPK